MSLCEEKNKVRRHARLRCQCHWRRSTKQQVKKDLVQSATRPLFGHLQIRAMQVETNVLFEAWSTKDEIQIICSGSVSSLRQTRLRIQLEDLWFLLPAWNYVEFWPYGALVFQLYLDRFRRWPHLWHLSFLLREAFVNNKIKIEASAERSW